MGLEGIMLSQISKTEKDKYRVISLVRGLLKLVATENRQMVARGGDEGWNEKLRTWNHLTRTQQDADKGSLRNVKVLRDGDMQAVWIRLHGLLPVTPGKDPAGGELQAAFSDLLWLWGSGVLWSEPEDGHSIVPQ